MKKLKLIPQSWHPSDSLVTEPSPTKASDSGTFTPETTHYSRGIPREEEGENGQKVAVPEKFGRLKDYLSSIDQIPARRVNKSRSMHGQSTHLSVLETLGDPPGVIVHSEVAGAKDIPSLLLRSDCDLICYPSSL